MITRVRGDRAYLVLSRTLCPSLTSFPVARPAIGEDSADCVRCRELDHKLCPQGRIRVGHHTEGLCRGFTTRYRRTSRNQGTMTDLTACSVLRR